jgi:hypothetical protein
VGLPLDPVDKLIEGGEDCFGLPGDHGTPKREVADQASSAQRQVRAVARPRNQLDLHRQSVGVTAGAFGRFGSSRHAQDRRQFTPNLDAQFAAFRHQRDDVDEAADKFPGLGRIVCLERTRQFRDPLPVDLREVRVEAWRRRDGGCP